MFIGLGETSFADFSLPEEGRNRGGRRDSSRNIEDENRGEFKSKNLEAERRRRQKLSDRLLELRSLVPNITNMNKATIITDAITYIEELHRTVTDLTDQLGEMDASPTENLEAQSQDKETADNAEEMKKWGIEPQVQVTPLNGAKLWIHIVCRRKIGVFTKLMEAFSVLGFELMDSSFTTSKGSFLVTSCVEATHCGLHQLDQIKDFLLETVTGI